MYQMIKLKVSFTLTEFINGSPTFRLKVKIKQCPEEFVNICVKINLTVNIVSDVP